MRNLCGPYRTRTVVALAVAAGGALLALSIPRGEARVWTAGMIAGAALGAALGLWRAGSSRGREALADEQRWMTSLPFPVEGWWELLAEDLSQRDKSREPIVYRRFRVTLEFAATTPEPKELHERLLSARVLELRGIEADGLRTELSLAIPERRIPEELRPTVHRLLDDALRALHLEHALASVEIASLQARQVTANGSS